MHTEVTILVEAESRDEALGIVRRLADQYGFKELR